MSSGPPWFLILGAALVASGCRGTDDDEDSASHTRVDDRGRVVLAPEERKALGLEMAVAAEGTLTTSALRFGKVVARPQEDVLVTAPLTGRLVAPKLALGATVAAGDALVTLEPLVDAASRATLEAQRRELVGQIEGARAQVEAKRADLNRLTTLVSSGLATAADRAQAEAALTAERARVESLRRASDALERMTGGRLELQAPAPGVVASLTAEPGSVIQQGAVVSRIVRAGPRWIDVAVAPSDPIGSGYRAQGISGWVRVTLLARGLVIQSDGTRRDRLEAASESAANLLPGATVPVELLRDHQGVLVPVNAVVRRGFESLVFIAAEEGRYEAKRVDVGARDETSAVISSGISAGDRVVTQGASSLLGELGAEGGGQAPGAQE
jgi:multidrug efflux pump subunit AcrA (membrane-fusion protein)